MTQTSTNETGKTGHHERNKVTGEGAVSATGAEATSTGGEGRMDDFDPDAPPPTDAGGRADPSMRAAVAQPATHDPEHSSFAPGGDKTSNPDVNAETMLDQTVGRDATRRQ